MQHLQQHNRHIFLRTVYVI